MYKFFKEDTSLNLSLTQLIKQLALIKAIMAKNIEENKFSMELDDNLDYLNLSSLKGKNILEILDELDILINADANNKQKLHLYNNLKTDFNYREIFQKILNAHIHEASNEALEKLLPPSLFDFCLPIKFKFIELPELALDFEYQSYNKECEICQSRGKDSLICLVCGKKVCNSTSCSALFEGDIVSGYMIHTKICGGGRTAYLKTFDCSVLFHSDNSILVKKLEPLYVNEFGEGSNSGKIGKEFKLNKEIVLKAIKMFTEYSYSN